MTARSVPAPPAFLAGQKLTATVMNQISTVQSFWADPPMFRQHLSIAQSIPNAVYTQIACDFVEYDSDTGLSGTTPYPYTVPVGQGGRWQLGGMISWAGNATGIRIAAIYKNGAQITGANAAAMAGPAANVTNVVVSATVNLIAGDVIGLYGYQSSGGSLNAQIGGGSPPFLEGRLISLANP